MKYRTGQNIANGSSATITFTPPREHFLSSLMIHSETKACLYVEVMLYHDDEDIRANRGELLFGNWLRVSTKTDLIVLNKWVDDEKHSLKLTLYNNTGGAVAVETTIYYYKQAFVQKNHYNEKKNHGIWLFHQRYKQTDAGGGSASITFSAKENQKIRIKNISFGPSGTLTSATDFTIKLLDENNFSFDYLLKGNTNTGFLFGPPLAVADNKTSYSTYSIGKNSDIEIIYPEKINFFCSSLAQNETIIIGIIAELSIGSSLPDISLASSGSIEIDTSYTNDYNKVI